MSGSELLNIPAAVDRLHRKFPAVRAIYLFGTAARDALRADSDIDLALDCGRPVSADLVFSATRDCESVLSRDVDLVDLHSAPLPLQAHIVSEGRKLLVTEPVEVAFFENEILSRYCAFIEERRPLLAAVRQRGSIYA